MHSDVLIVGAGISGLSFAHYCRRQGLTPLLLERERRSGGSLHSHRIAGAGTPFWVELGAHSCFNSYRNLLAILEQLGLLETLLKRRKIGFRVLAAGRLQSIGSQLHWPELLRSLPRLFTLNKAGRSVADYYSRIVGPRNYQALFAPAFDAVICQPSADFPADLLFRSKRRRRDVTRSYTLSGGLQTIAELIAAQPGIILRHGQEIRSMAYSDRLFTLVTSDGNRYTSPRLCLATPVDTAATLLRESFPELADLLARVRTVSVETLAVALDKDALKLPPLGGIIARDDSFFSVVSRDNLSHPAYRGFTFHFKPDHKDQETRLQRIGAVLGTDTRRFRDVVFKTNRLPALAVRHDDLITEIDRRLAGLPLALTGNYFTGLSLESCVTRSLAEFSRLSAAATNPGP